MISYAGVYLAAPTADVLTRVEAALDPATVRDWDRRAWPGNAVRGLNYPAAPEDPPHRINTLFWPVGASRWAVGRFLVGDEALLAISAAVYSGGSGYAAATLRIDERAPDDPPSVGRVGYAVEASMYMLPPRPVFQAGVPSGLWEITLVDDRYFWQERSGVVDITQGTTTWAQLYQQIAGLLGITITVDDVHADYLYPPEAFATQYDSLPLLLDAVALSVGQRVVRGTDGTVRARSPENASPDVWLNRANFDGDGKRSAGGAFRLTPPDADDVPAQVPAAVNVTFPRADEDGELTGDLYAVTTTLASLSLAEAGGRPGHAGTFYAHSSLAALAESGSPTNLSALTALASRWAADWYRWRLGWVDLLLGGVVPWRDDGFHDLEWGCRPGYCATRVRAATGATLCGGALGTQSVELGHSDGTTVIVGEGACCEPGFPVQITEVYYDADLELWWYSWVEVEYDCTGVSPLPGGRTGTRNAYNVGGSTTIPVGSVVWNRPTGDCYSFYELEEFFPAKLTEVGGTAYSWVEVQATAGGGWVARADGRTGTLNAFELNERDNVPVNSVVWMRLMLTEVPEYRFAYEIDDCDGYYTGSKTVVTAVSFNSATCVLSVTTETWDFDCGRLEE